MEVELLDPGNVRGGAAGFWECQRWSCWILGMSEVELLDSGNVRGGAAGFWECQSEAPSSSAAQIYPKSTPRLRVSPTLAQIPHQCLRSSFLTDERGRVHLLDSGPPTELPRWDGDESAARRAQIVF
ncbi:hypothetical protein KOW79_003675 [Hemibagrus wyckioides]|uniref:Uncharacterized protein n=1 Tax=Hemibagrus wyckioides TaxID=337641 RepID=A0A9D3P5U8_9TELE|nr:hypothetical protein KOW79_003675 [Hemibagrus wyckioides]